jgi:hypothetical protein
MEEAQVPRRWIFPIELLKNNRKGHFGIEHNIEGVREDEHYIGRVRNGLPHTYKKGLIEDDMTTEEVSLQETGKFTFSDSSTYEGQFYMGKFHGKGKRVWCGITDMERSYNGQWEHGQMHGHGKYVDSNYTYTGTFVNGLKEGKGVLVYADKTIRIGEWQAGEELVNTFHEFTNGQSPDQVECGECGPRFNPDGTEATKDCCNRPLPDCSGRQHATHCAACDGGDAVFDHTTVNTFSLFKDLEHGLEALLVNTHTDDDDQDKARFIEGHESYNMDTVAEYKKKFGLNQVHLARAAPNDWILKSANLKREVGADRNEIREILRECAPRKMKKAVYNDNKELVGVSWFVPRHTLLLNRIFGNTSCCNNKSGCECLAEPHPISGTLPSYSCPCCAVISSKK